MRWDLSIYTSHIPSIYFIMRHHSPTISTTYDDTCDSDVTPYDACNAGYRDTLSRTKETYMFNDSDRTAAAVMSAVVVFAVGLTVFAMLS